MLTTFTNLLVIFNQSFKSEQWGIKKYELLLETDVSFLSWLTSYSLAAYLTSLSLGDLGM